MPDITTEGRRLVQLAVRDFTAKLPHTVPEDIYALADRHRGAKGRRYRDAADRYLQVGLNPSDASCKMFVKAERFNPGAECDPEPRAIQFRGAKYCVCLAQYLRPIEEIVYLTDDISDGVPRSRNVAKGLNSVKRAEVLVNKLTAFNRPIVVALDASTFDAHVNGVLLRAEHAVYRSSNGDPEFLNLLRKQLVNKVYTTLGAKYTVCARRMSGDMNTAIGNVILMLLMLLGYCRHHLKLARWDTFDDGDDCLIIIEDVDWPRVRDSLKPIFLEYGMELKVDEPARLITDVVFCQSKVVEFSPGRWKFVRDYRIVMSKSTSGVRNWGDPQFRTRVIHANGTCELILNLGVPVLQEYALALLRNSAGDKDRLKHAKDGLRLRALREAKALGVRCEDVRPTNILPCARASFAASWGMTECDQIALERKLRLWTFCSDTIEVWGPEWNARAWTGAQSTAELHRL